MVCAVGRVDVAHPRSRGGGVTAVYVGSQPCLCSDNYVRFMEIKERCGFLPLIG